MIGTLEQLIRTVAPDYIWVSSYDILIAVEMINEEVNESSLKATLCRMCANGLVEMKRADTAKYMFYFPHRKRHGGSTYLYRVL